MEMGILSTIVTSASWDQVVKSTGKNEMAGAVGLIFVYIVVMEIKIKLRLFSGNCVNRNVFSLYKVNINISLR